MSVDFVVYKPDKSNGIFIKNVKSNVQNDFTSMTNVINDFKTAQSNDPDLALAKFTDGKLSTPFYRPPLKFAKHFTIPPEIESAYRKALDSYSQPQVQINEVREQKPVTSDPFILALRERLEGLRKYDQTHDFPMFAIQILKQKNKYDLVKYEMVFEELLKAKQLVFASKDKINEWVDTTFTDTLDKFDKEQAEINRRQELYNSDQDAAFREYGGAPTKHKYKGKSYKVRTGKRGGKYIAVNDKKIYI